MVALWIWCERIAVWHAPSSVLAGMATGSTPATSPATGSERDASMTRKLISSGTIWERKYGYSRAVQVGNLVIVAGTTAVDEHGTVMAPGSPAGQAAFIYEKIARALAEAGASLADVVRVRTFVVDIGRWEEV